FRGPAGNGIVPGKLKLLPQPRRLWKAPVGTGNASLIIQANRLYTVGKRPGKGMHLICLDTATGKLLWERQMDSWFADSSPTLDRGRLYLLCTYENKPVVYACSATDGKVLWQTKLSKPDGQRHYGHAGSPLLWQDLVIVNAGTGAALNRDTGAVVWQHEGLGGLATPVLYREKTQTGVLIFGGKSLHARDGRSGRELWSIAWKTNLAVNAGDPIYHNQRLFISTDYGKHAALFDVRTTTPKQLWKEQGSSFSSGFLWQGNLYCFTGGEFACLDFATGQKRWKGPHMGKGSAILADGKIILLSENGRLAIAPLSTDGFQPTIQEQIHGGTTWAPPSLVNGRLYLRNKEGQAICLQIGATAR
ncbi:MAG: PQQ-like beta-propeller repeat protein, partial [Phycisphaerae bacterium]|nr:PQQ-like beta-propeller repeat protein [Phycisphaerae bacterium]